MASTVEKRGDTTIYIAPNSADSPSLDLLSFLFENPQNDRLRSDTILHADAANPSRNVTMAQQISHLQRLAHTIRTHPDIKALAGSAGALAGLPKDRFTYFGDSGDVELYQVESNMEILQKATTCIVYTGGTTGPPKAIPISHANIVASVFLFMEPFRHDPKLEFRTVAHVPTTHLSGIQGYITLQTHVGGTVFWMTRFDLPQLVAHGKRYSATMLLSPPPLWLAIAKAPFVTDQLSTMVVGFSSAAPMGAEVQNAAQRKLGGGQLGQVWEMSEASGPMTVLPLNERGESGSLAVLVANSEMRIVDEEGKDVTPGVTGEAWVRGPCQSVG
ncbi:hypothetical protein VD0001_g3156 [Verticillium dahliae]|nr:hypothetical protein VD0001_g3156 [Verticillium dahliae]